MTYGRLCVRVSKNSNNPLQVSVVTATPMAAAEATLQAHDLPIQLKSIVSWAWTININMYLVCFPYKPVTIDSCESEAGDWNKGRFVGGVTSSL